MNGALFELHIYNGKGVPEKVHAISGADEEEVFFLCVHIIQEHMIGKREYIEVAYTKLYQNGSDGMEQSRLFTRDPVDYARALLSREEPHVGV